MPHAWTMTLEQFLGDHPEEMDDASDAERFSRIEVEAASKRGWRSSTVRRLGDRYALASARDDARDVVLLHLEQDEWEACGGYVADSLWVDPVHRGRGLGQALVEAKFEACGGEISPGAFSEAGLKAHAAAHRAMVMRAMAAGYRVPDQVRRQHGTRPGERITAD